MKFNITDKPDGLVKTHKKPIAYLGGVGILTGLITGSLVGIELLESAIPASETTRTLKGVLYLCIFISIVGLVDDLVDLKPGVKLICQIIAAIGLVAIGIHPKLSQLFGASTQLNSEWIDLIFGVILAIFFVVGTMNSINLLDGLDGLCGGITIIILSGMLLLQLFVSSQSSTGPTADSAQTILCLALIGGICGFLPMNWSPARIFMGDAGSLLLGLLIASVMLLFADTVSNWLIATLFIIGFPFIDTMTTIVRRLVNNRPLSSSDKGHIYDQLTDLGWNTKKTVAICYSLTAIYVIFGVAVSQLQTQIAFLVFTAIFFMTGLLIWTKGFLSMQSR